MRDAPPGGAVASGLAGMFDVGRDLPAELAGILLAEVDLVFGAAEPEPQRLIRWASIKVIFEFDSDPLCHRGLHDCDGLSAPYKINRDGVIIASPRPPTRIGAPGRHRTGAGPGQCEAPAGRPGDRPVQILTRALMLGWWAGGLADLCGADVLPGRKARGTRCDCLRNAASGQVGASSARPRSSSSVVTRLLASIASS
jgi:hypothetical protein